MDFTPPTPGTVNDSRDGIPDAEYISDVASVEASWDGFADPESGIAKFKISVLVNNEVNTVKMEDGDANKFEEHTFHLKLNDFVEIAVEGINGAGATTKAISNGYRIDTTPPGLRYLKDTESGLKFQDDDTKLTGSWLFVDPESGIKDYRLTIHRQYGGNTEQIIPEIGDQEDVMPDENGVGAIEKTGLSLTNGARYFVRVTAVNNAFLSAQHESPGVIIDITKPTMDLVS